MRWILRDVDGVRQACGDERLFDGFDDTFDIFWGIDVNEGVLTPTLLM